MNANSENLKLWNSVEKTDPRFTKKVSYGKRSFTTIDAYYQIKTATSLWGSYGSCWGLKNIKISISNELGMCLLEGAFYYPGGEFPIINAIRISDDEFMKKLYTDSLTKALSYLGFNSDVFLGYFDDSRYVEKVKKEFETQNQPQESQPQPQPQPQPEPTPKPTKTGTDTKNESIDILIKSGVEVKEEKGVLIASGNATYQNKTLLKNLGFSFDRERKAWIKKVA